MGHRSIAVTVDIYGHLVPGGNRSAVIAWTIGAHLGASPAHPAQSMAHPNSLRKSFVMNGEPPRNRTENPQIKSLLLCQLS
jgi:hypothetical protein